MGHEYVGRVEEVGAEVKDVRPGDYVVGSFVISDGTCEICRAGITRVAATVPLFTAGLVCRPQRLAFRSRMGRWWPCRANRARN